ncbi:MAG: DNA phosphorothioation system sulfurtransferase DndC [Bacilli bacterium]|nr:DNA phosphorothioation system sulfurtransferase DndC [Bacilli bacterium]
MKLSSIVENNSKYREAIERVKRVYRKDNRPWIIGYSGGKDSTATCHVVLNALQELDPNELTKHVYIISSDTMVETPLIIKEIDLTLFKIEKFAREHKIPISTHIVQPQFDNSFWSNTIGRGYPCPNQSFRWCTDRMKIEPANRFIKEVVNDSGEVIMILGIRKGESNSRDRVISNHSIKDNDLMRHTTMTNAYTFAPIIEYTIDDVWDTLLNYPSPWGGDNYELFKLYSDSNSGSECPLVVDEETKNSTGSCGNSRFGCWVCTVVAEDKALNGFIKSGVKWLFPLLEYRNWLYNIRDDRTLRMKRRANGQIYFSPITEKDGKLIISKKGDREKIEIDFDGIDNNGEKWNIFNNKSDVIKYIRKNGIDLASEIDPKIICKTTEGYGQLGLGPFTYDARKEILKKLLLLQKRIKDEYNVEHELIKKQELIAISKLWLEQGFWNDDVNKIYYEVFNEELNFISDDIKLLNDNELEILKDICLENNVDFELIKKVLYLEKNSYGLTRRENLQRDLARLLNQDYIHI